MKMIRILLFSMLLWNSFMALEAQVVGWMYSSNPADYNFGWFANGTYVYPPQSLPQCTYCVNALTYDRNYVPTPGDQANGLYWNLTVGMYRCDGVQLNEFWAYHDATRTIVFGNLTQVLCIDAADWGSLGVLKLRYCNSSSVSQQWVLSGTRVISALVGAGGEELFMLGELPNKETNPTSTVAAFPLSLSSSLPNVSSTTPEFSYTAHFQFFTSRGLIDTSINRFTAEGLLQLTNNSMGTIVNGGFERSTIQSGADVGWNDWVQAQPSYFSLCGWVIDYGPIDYVRAGLLPPAEGSYSVHLNTLSDTAHWGQMSQTIRTQAGSRYHLSFYFNGFPPELYIESRPTWHCGPTYDEAKLQVRVAAKNVSTVLPYDLVLQSVEHFFFNMNVSDSNAVNFGGLWQHHAVKFTAMTNITTISFSSLNFQDSCGPVVDKVALWMLKP